MVKVKLRTKAITGGRKTLYLDIYPPILNPVTGRKTRREFLRLYTFDEPKTAEQKYHNKQTLSKADNILTAKKLLLEKGKYQFEPEKEISVSFNEVEEKNRTKDFLIELLLQVRNIEKQILEQLKL